MEFTTAPNASESADPLAPPPQLQRRPSALSSGAAGRKVLRDLDVDMSQNETFLQQLESRLVTARRELADMFEMLQLEADSKQELLTKRDNSAIASTVSKTYAKAITQAGMDIDSRIKTMLSSKPSSQDLIQIASSPQSKKPPSSPRYTSSKSSDAQQIQSAITAVLENLANLIIKDLREQQPTRKQDIWTQDLHNELDKHRAYAAQLKQQLSDAMERLKRHDVKMDILRGHLLRRNKLLEEQRTSYYKELLILREQLYQKKVGGDVTSTNDWGRFFDKAQAERSPEASPSGDSDGDDNDDDESRSTRSPNSSIRTYRQKRSKSFREVGKVDFELNQMQQEEIAKLRSEISLLEQKMATRDEEMSKYILIDGTNPAPSENEVITELIRKLNEQQQDFNARHTSLQKQIEMREKIKWEKTVEDKLAAQKDLFLSELAVVSNDFRLEIKDWQEALDEANNKRTDLEFKYRELRMISEDRQAAINKLKVEVREHQHKLEEVSLLKLLEQHGKLEGTDADDHVMREIMQKNHHIRNLERQLNEKDAAWDKLKREVLEVQEEIEELRKTSPQATLSIRSKTTADMQLVEALKSDLEIKSMSYEELYTRFVDMSTRKTNIDNELKSIKAEKKKTLERQNSSTSLIERRKMTSLSIGNSLRRSNSMLAGRPPSAYGQSESTFQISDTIYESFPQQSPRPRTQSYTHSQRRMSVNPAMSPRRSSVASFVDISKTGPLKDRKKDSIGNGPQIDQKKGPISAIQNNSRRPSLIGNNLIPTKYSPSESNLEVSRLTAKGNDKSKVKRDSSPTVDIPEPPLTAPATSTKTFEEELEKDPVTTKSNENQVGNAGPDQVGLANGKEIGGSATEGGFDGLKGNGENEQPEYALSQPVASEIESGEPHAIVASEEAQPPTETQESSEIVLDLKEVANERAEVTMSAPEPNKTPTLPKQGQPIRRATPPREYDRGPWTQERLFLYSRIQKLEAELEASRGQIDHIQRHLFPKSMVLPASKKRQMSNIEITNFKEGVQKEIDLQEEETLAKWRLLYTGISNNSKAKELSNIIRIPKVISDEVKEMAVFERLEVRSKIQTERYRETLRKIREQRKSNIEKVLNSVYLLVQPSVFSPGSFIGEWDTPSSYNLEYTNFKIGQREIRGITSRPKSPEKIYTARGSTPEETRKYHDFMQFKKATPPPIPAHATESMNMMDSIQEKQEFPKTPTLPKYSKAPSPRAPTTPKVTVAPVTVTPRRIIKGVESDGDFEEFMNKRDYFISQISPALKLGGGFSTEVAIAKKTPRRRVNMAPNAPFIDSHELSLSQPNEQTLMSTEEKERFFVVEPKAIHSGPPPNVSILSSKAEELPITYKPVAGRPGTPFNREVARSESIELVHNIDGSVIIIPNPNIY